MDHAVGLAILVEGGVQCLPEVQFRDRLLDPALVNRQTGSQLQQREGAIVFSISTVDFFRRLITRVAEFISRVRHCLPFTLAEGGYPRLEEGRGGTGNDIKVEEAASGACEPPFAETVVSEKETTSHAESKLLDYEDSESNCSRQITMDHEQPGTCVNDNATLLADNHGTACQTEFASPCDPHLQIPANSATCEPGMTSSSELNDGHCILQHDMCHCQDASREEELRDDGIRNKFLTIEAPSGACDSKPETSGRGGTGNDIKVEEAASGACEPPLAETVVSEKETTSHAESKLLDYEDSESNCSRQITMDHEQPGTCVNDNATLLADNHGTACQTEFASPCDPHLQIPANSATCEPGMTSSSELNDGHCILQHDMCHCQDASREEELRDDGIRNKFLTIEAPSGACDSKPETSVEESAHEQVATSKSVNKKFSIHQLNAMVAEQLIKYLHALERNVVPAATLTQKTTHWRAIILATLVAVAVWARNSRHLHESMPWIKGSSIYVHIRSRL